MQAEDIATGDEMQPWPVGHPCAPRETDGDLMTRLGMDAEKWAVEFGTRFASNTVNLNPFHPSRSKWVDKADLIGWFANAIMAGYDRGREQGDKDLREKMLRDAWTPKAAAAWDEASTTPHSVTKIATLLVPRIGNDGHNLDAEHAALQVELISTFGGYTAMPAIGAWRDGLAIYRDELTKYEVAIADETGERDLQRLAAASVRRFRQQCIMIWLPDGTAICVDAEGGVR